MSDPVLAVEQIGFNYGAKQALSEVTFSLSPGAYYALLGPNGAGKSTLFSILCQLLQPQTGSVTVNGISAAKKPRQVLKQIGMVFQQPTLDLDLSVEQNLAYHASLHGLSNAYTKQRINEELQRFALSERRKDKVRSLNGGHRRRVEIARALLHQPAILLLDEATVGLDQSTRDTINDHLRQLCSDSGITILSSTHLIDEVRPNDELIVLIKGQIQLQQRCKEAMQALQLDSVQALYRHFHQQGEQQMYWTCFVGVLKRELLRFWQQRSRLISALVRPLLWLVVFAAGFRAALGVAIIPPYETYITYEVYIIPGLAGVIMLFNGMQSSLSMVYDREMGSMKVLLTSPMPRPFLLVSKLLAGACISLLQVYAFFAIAWLLEVEAEPIGYLLVMPALLLTALLLGALGLLLSSFIKQLENFAGVMNFVVFPMFFLSSALYPLWKMRESSEWLYWICQFNPFTHAVELIRFALYGQFNGQAALVTGVCTLIFTSLAIWGYDPKRGMVKRKVGGQLADLTNGWIILIAAVNKGQLNDSTSTNITYRAFTG